MIEDGRLRELFSEESAEYLQRLDDGLLALERSPVAPGAVEALFRDVHSLKGAAHMLGLESVELLARSLEDMLHAVRHEAESCGVEYVREMLRQLADIRAAVAEVLHAPPADAAVPAPGLAREGLHRAPAGTSPSFGLDAVRVDAVRLDGLLSSAGELTVARTRVLRRLGELDHISEQLEELRRAVAKRGAADPDGALMTLERLSPIDATVSRLAAALADDCARLELVGNELSDGVRSIRLLPLANIFRQFPRMVQELARAQGKSVEFVIEGEDVGADKRILEDVRDPLMHLLRNAVDHGVETSAERARAGKPAVGRIRLRARRAEGAIEIEVRDDGRGLDEEAVRQAARGGGVESDAVLAAMPPEQVRMLIFRPGLTTAPLLTDLSGRGVGLDVVRDCVERMKGTLAIESEAGRGMALTMRLPATLLTARILIVEVNGRPYGLPVEHVVASRKVAAADRLQFDGRAAILSDGEPVPLIALADLLGRPAAGSRDVEDAGTTVILATVAGRFGLRVDALLDEQEVVLKPLGGLLEGVRNVAGATILDNGAICMVLSPPELLGEIRRSAVASAGEEAEPAPERAKRVLLAEDSITTRTQESRILAAAGYEVVTAVDGLDALQKLARGEFDAVITDVNMPKLDGLGLARRIRCETRHAELPIILVTSLASDEDRMRGLEAGANAYIAKAGFDQRELIECLDRLI